MTPAVRMISLNLIAALIGAAALVTLSEAAPAVVRLAPVHIVAQRLPVVTLPRVEILAQRSSKPIAKVFHLRAVEASVQRPSEPALLTAQAITQREPI